MWQKKYINPCVQSHVADVKSVDWKLNNINLSLLSLNKFQKEN